MEQPQKATIYAQGISDIRRDFLASSDWIRKMNAAYKTMIQKGMFVILYEVSVTWSEIKYTYK